MTIFKTNRGATGDRRGVVPSAASSAKPGHGFGTGPVFLTSLSTILGAILFLRFGYAVAHAGLWGTFMIVALAHLVTIPTVLAVSEIATNRRVAGGGAYFIISRSFGPSIGGAIGIALFLSQAISVAFYFVAFAEAFEPAFEWLANAYGLAPDARWVSLPSLLLLVVVMLAKGAYFGVHGLYVVCAVLALSIIAFLLGEGPEAILPDGINLTATITNPDAFGTVFATCFPAFTGMIAGLGLSGDLRNPQKSIPVGSIAATFAGMAIYLVVAVKLARSATPEALAGDQFIMSQIAAWGPAIYLGLGAAALSSALGSMLVAPRTLQALAKDRIFPIPELNRLLAQGRGDSQEPIHAMYVASGIAVVFVLLGGVDFIAQVLSMFFMVTYGALCAVSFLEYFSGNPSYRPTFHTRWYLSLLGAVMCGIMMINMNPFYAFLAISLMGLVYFGLRRTRHGERDLTAIFQGTMFQLTRRLQIVLQKNRIVSPDGGWRPSVVALTRTGESHLAHFDLIRWICHRHGFGHFIQYIEGEYSFAAELEARTQVDRLIDRSQVSGAGIFVDTFISPTFERAMSQVLQIPGISGLPNNTVLFEFDRDDPRNVDEIAQAAHLAGSSQFNVLILRSTKNRFGYRSKIHLWLTEDKTYNAPLMLLLAYIIVGHPDWRRAQIKLFACFGSHDARQEAEKLSELMEQGRLPITKQNVEAVACENPEALEQQVTRRSLAADLLIAGLTAEQLYSKDLPVTLETYRNANDVLFVYSCARISIE